MSGASWGVSEKKCIYLNRETKNGGYKIIKDVKRQIAP
jgi:hypothetical protein